MADLQLKKQMQARRQRRKKRNYITTAKTEKNLELTIHTWIRTVDNVVVVTSQVSDEQLLE